MFLKRIERKAYLLVAGMLCCVLGWAQTAPQAALKTYIMSDGATFRAMSDNGEWAVAFGANEANSLDAYPKLVHLTDQSVIALDEGLNLPTSSAADVTDDGKIVVGSLNSQPAIWNADTKKWSNLPVAKGCDTGKLNAVTPDGHYAVGICGKSSMLFYEEPAMWDLTTNTLIELPNLPTADLSGFYQSMMRFTSMSADARYILGCVSYSYPQDVLYFVYDRQNSSVDPIIFDYDAATKKYTSKDSRVLNLDGINISNNGQWLAGILYTTDDQRSPFRYNLETKELDLYLDSDDMDKGCVTVDNSGTVYCATPALYPTRSLYVRHGKYWYGMDEILSQRFGVDYYKMTGFDATGLTIGIADDCSSIVATAYISQDNYHVFLSETFAEACEHVNLLKDYTISPLNGASLSKLSNLQLTFTRKVDVLGNTSDVVLKDEAGNVVRSALKFAVNANNPRIVNIGFRTTTLEAGKNYTVFIPAGTISLEGDDSRTNSDIQLNYNGYGNSMLQLLSVLPAEGSTMGSIDMTTTPVVFSFDTQVAVVDGAKALVYRNDETLPIAELSLVAGNTPSTYHQVMAYPLSTLILYKGSSYRVVLPAGSVSELSGNVVNEECSVSYEGVYERIITSDNTHIFIEDFNHMIASMMVFDNDHNEPVSAMKDMGFVSSIGWIHAADDDYTNTCAVSHSMYTPAGKSDDWMVTPQLFIPDDRCELTFKAQSLLSTKNDTLKVIVYATDDVYNEMTSQAVDIFRSQGEVLMNERLSPGQNENKLAGDWQEYRFDLAKYAGKKIYIAFVNENEDQSAIFVANVGVTHEANVELTLSDVEPVQIDATSQIIKGQITIVDDMQTFTDFRLQLLDADMQVLDELNVDGLQLKKGDTYPFAFNKELPLAKGKYNVFYVSLSLNEGAVVLNMGTYIKNLAFKTNKRVVLEEATGQDCVNCPLGHIMIEKLEELYGENFIPLCYHSYTGDPYVSGMEDYATNFLQLTNVPTAIINRLPMPFSSIISDMENGQRKFYNSSKDNPLWLDVVADEMSYAADADLNISASYDQSTDLLTIPYDFRSALDMDNASIGLFCVITEDGLVGYQRNAFSNENDELLGEWKLGGTYGKSVVYPYTFNNVSRALYPANNYYGKSGLLPANIVNSENYTGNMSFTMADNASYVAAENIGNCKVTLMALNMATGELLNAARAKVEITTGIDGVQGDGSAVRIDLTEGGLSIHAANETRVSVYALDGTELLAAAVNGVATLPVNYHGVVIVKAVNNGKSVEKKVVLK